MDSVKGVVGIDNLEAFRSSVFLNDIHRNYPGAKNLVKDEWDITSEHIICTYHAEIVGSARVIPASRGALPFTSNVSEPFMVSEIDSEMGRFVVRPDMRKGPAFLGLLIGCAAVYREQAYARALNGAIYADVIIEGRSRLNERTYKTLGFKSSNVKYFDKDYAAECEIFVIDKANRNMFMDYVHKMYKHYRAN